MGNLDRYSILSFLLAEDAAERAEERDLPLLLDPVERVESMEDKVD